MNSNQLVTAFIEKSIEIGDLHPIDAVYAWNKLLHLLDLGHYELEAAAASEKTRLDILDALVEYAVDTEVIEDLNGHRDVLSSQIMDLITPRPSEVNAEFWSNYEESPKRATDTFFEMSQRNDYIKTRAIAQNIVFTQETDYGELQMAINLSKPEKDPKEIELASQLDESTTYPPNALVVENEGFTGSLTQPGRSNHRIVRMNLGDDPWGFQYSPYAYYNEHSIFLALEHRPMDVGPQAIRNILEIVSQLPHYFVGSNAGLPIVGGSILSHDHYQGGRHEFPIQDAAYTHTFVLSATPSVEAGILEWPMSVVRLRSENQEELAEAGIEVMQKWEDYTDESVGILAYSGDEPHNAITPIARKDGDVFELDLVLRNNRRSGEYPDDIFHPHPDVQHIKRENIGLIEVLGLAILPPRLKDELYKVEQFLLGKVEQVEPIHQDWADELKEKHEITEENVREIVEAGVGEVFLEVLKDAGVFKTDEQGQAAFIRFIEESFD